MTPTLDLSSDRETGLRDARLSSEEIDAALDELSSIGADLPPSDDTEMHSRENLYIDHD
jgi:hypothetical protein